MTDIGDDATLGQLRKIIEEVAQDWKGSHRVVESLKWGQPSFALSPKHGTAVRIGKNKAGDAALYVHCGTTIVADWREECAMTGVSAKTEGNRALIVDPTRVDDVRGFIRRAFGYRRG